MLNKTVEFSAIWDAMTLMWRHCNMRSLPATPTHLTSSLGFAHPEKSEIGLYHTGGHGWNHYPGTLSI